MQRKEVIIVDKYVEKLQELYQNTIISQGKGKQKKESFKKKKYNYTKSMLYPHHYYLHQVDHLSLNQFSYKKKLIT